MEKTYIVLVLSDYSMEISTLDVYTDIELALLRFKEKLEEVGANSKEIEVAFKEETFNKDGVTIHFHYTETR